MKNIKRKELLVALIWLGIVCVGCGGKTSESVPEKEETVVSEQQTQVTEIEETTPETETDAEEAAPEIETDAEETTPESATDLTFDDLSKRQFWFSSGAGGWSDEFVIESDGSFTGAFHDSDMGGTGEGYPNGTVYSSNYSGHFTDLTKVDEHTYKMTLSDITYEQEPGKEEILDEVLYSYTEAYALGRNDTFYIYLPGTPVSQFPEAVWIWLRGGNESETELTMTVIVDEENQFGICSGERSN